MDQEEISHQQSLVTDSFSTIERLENDMAAITREFEGLDDNGDINANETDGETEVEIAKDVSDS